MAVEGGDGSEELDDPSPDFVGVCTLCVPSSDICTVACPWYTGLENLFEDFKSTFWNACERSLSGTDNGLLLPDLVAPFVLEGEVSGK